MVEDCQEDLGKEVSKKDIWKNNECGREEVRKKEEFIDCKSKKKMYVCEGREEEY